MRTRFVFGLLAAVAAFVACSSEDAREPSAVDAGADASGGQAQCGAIELCPCDDGYQATAGCGFTAGCDDQCASHGGNCSFLPNQAPCVCGDGTGQYLATCPSRSTCALACLGHCGDGDGGATTDCFDGDVGGPKDGALD